MEILFLNAYMYIYFVTLTFSNYCSSTYLHMSHAYICLYVFMYVVIYVLFYFCLFQKNKHTHLYKCKLKNIC